MSARMMIEAAEALIYSTGDMIAGLEMLGRALEVVDDEDDFVDALILKAEAENALGDRDADLQASLEELAACMLQPPELTRVGEMWLHLSNDRAAASAFHEALSVDETCGDAYRGLGIAAFARGDNDEAIRFSLAARRCYLHGPRPPWQVSVDEMERIAEAAMAELPDHIIERLENVPILIEEVPSEALVREGVDPRLLGLFSGVPLGEKSTEGQVGDVDRIHLYHYNLERACTSSEHLAAEIRITLLHETAHFFGLDDDELDQLGLG